MSHQYDNVRSLGRGQVSHPRRYARPAKVIPLHPHLPLSLPDPRLWWAVGFSFLVIATVVLLAAMLVISLPSANDVLIHLAPGWPWW